MMACLLSHITALEANFFLAQGQVLVYHPLNNTPQAYPVVRCSDAQTGGLLIYGGCYAL